MAKKNVRELKVCAQSGYNYKSVPAIRLMRQWLEGGCRFPYRRSGNGQMRRRQAYHQLGYCKSGAD